MERGSVGVRVSGDSTIDVAPPPPPFEIPLAECRSTVTPERPIHEVLRDFERKIRGAYVSAEVLRYHNWEGHISESLAALEMFRERCDEAGVEVDWDALKAAVLGHDAFLTVDEKLFGMKSKEQYASFACYNLLRELGASEQFARKVEQVINATHALVEPVTFEQKLMRAIDVRNVGGAFEEFYPNTIRLWEESQNLSGRSVTFEKFVDGAMQFLPLFFPPLFRVTPRAVDSEERSVWHMAAIRNVVQLYRDSRPIDSKKVTVVAELGAESPSETILLQRGLARHDFLLGVGDSDMMKRALDIAQQLRGRGLIQGPSFFSPGSASAAPIPGGLCHEVYLHVGEDVDALREALRVLHPTGALIVRAPSSKAQRILAQRGFVGSAPKGAFSSEWISFVRSSE